LRKAWKLALRRPAAVAAAVLLVAAVSATTLAARTARHNRQLQGYRTVTIETEPRGARVAFVPLDKSNGEPDVKHAVRAGDDDTIVTELKPGDYFVVAALPDGRFHEVYRHVPEPLEMVPAALRHRRWAKQADGSIRLPEITISPWKVDETMAFLAGSNAFQMGMPGRGQAPRQVRSVAPFYMDTQEFTVATALLVIGKLMPEMSFRERQLGEAVSVPFDWAAKYAEDQGKRLPTEAEYEYAATNGGTSRYPWGNELEEFTPTGFVAAPYDRHAVDSRLTGLCSGKAEWTMSWQPDLAGHNSGDPQRWRVIRGGNYATAAGDPSVTAESRDPRKAYYVERDRTLPGLGFRCVRSAAPLLSYDQMQ
jgi:formylglycine-generating enzyme required for sulfatase activity